MNIIPSIFLKRFDTWLRAGVYSAGRRGAADVVSSRRWVRPVVLGALLPTSSLAMGCRSSAARLAEGIWKWSNTGGELCF